MEGCVTEASPPSNTDNKKTKDVDSTVNFQRFVYDLFEKNGILNDLRAYLRGHIVDVIKSAQTGEPPICQKHFTQRLELTYQALNMLIAEYLLRLEFSYSLSVFVSEIPLANMVFTFAKNLMMNNNGNFEELKFKDSDVWSIINYLGMKCDSEHATRIVEMYNSKENLPLLLCILKCLPMYQQEPCYEERAISSSESATSSVKSFDEEKHVRSASKVCAEKCRHYVVCRTCQARVSRLKDKYRKKKKHLIQNIKSDPNPVNIESLMRNIGVVERSLVDEMFQQLKGVYEAEMEMMKQDEEKKIKRSLASHALQLQRRRDEMEQSFKMRTQELEESAREKKRFLVGLAQALRQQQAALAHAHQAVRKETNRLADKENSLKSQLLEAEEVLRNRGEEMRKQISSELVILEGHLESMKRERESINRERAELENLKVACNSSCVIKVHDLNNEELKSHYDLLKDELSILKKYLETTRLEPKCVIERSTITDPDVGSKIHALNNEQDVDRVPQKSESDERKTPNKVVNDLKKQKNVNFCASNVDELYREGGCSRSSVSSEGGDRDHGVILVEQLKEENERLKTFARQQRSHIDELTSHGARLQAELTAARLRGDCARPRTAPAHMPYDQPLRLNDRASISSVGWRKGAGEELSFFSNAQPRVLLPGDTLPFIGVLRDRHSDNRRHLINTWRALRRRASPLAKPKHAPPRDRPGTSNPAIPVCSSPSAEDIEEASLPQMNKTFTFTADPQERTHLNTERRKETHQARERSPKPVLNETKEKIKKQPAKDSDRDKSPGRVLREAKLRLRKLEIEAEAVEQSYLDFCRRRQAKRQAESSPVPDEDVAAKLDIPRITHHRVEGSYRVENIPRFNITPAMDSAKRDFDKYLCDYQSNYNVTSNFKTSVKTTPIPEYGKVVADKDQPKKRENYLEAPLAEFRKLYTQTSPLPSVPVHLPSIENQETHQKPETTLDNIRDSKEPRKSPRNFKNTSDELQILDIRDSNDHRKSPRNVKSKRDELEILKDNISKMYNLQTETEIEQKIEGAIVKSESPKRIEDNLIVDVVEENLIVEVENVSETNSLKVMESDTKGDLLLVVESSVDAAEVARSERQEELSAHMTIIVSPKRSLPTGAKEIENVSMRSERSVSPEQAARLTRNDVLDAIFHSDATRQSSVEVDLAVSTDLGSDRYPDDFSADVDNYNSRSEYDNDNDNDNSPISLHKASEDENFWDS